MTTLDVLGLMSSPTYDPTKLRHLPQPVPNDLPPEIDGSVFTFEDAFEDLLAISQGQRLPDITARYQQRRLLGDMFPSGEPTWFWLRRLESQGLVQVPNRARSFQAHQPDWSNFHKELDRHAANAWRSVGRALNSDARHVGEFFEGIDKAFEELGQGVREGSTRSSGVHREENTGLGKEPDTMEELFSEMSSMFKQHTSSWDTFIKNITEQAQAKSQEEYSETQGHGRYKNKVVTDENEYVDRFGYLHKSITRKTLDADGNEVGSQTHVTIRPADKHLDNENKGEVGGDGAFDVGPDTRKSSWFWK
ncbi:hypothetical protein NOR_08491 [Metarhizium rileyi]|uniref:Uncharacterized protein n=1 Tax=Metarhizium rileyi (strain RCEF 4871) TaxID=1649241 RepID=A0A166W787_METRR|nr:hypothetical protein NOR_08491 [Metarhizium rileyi RCEF 4871]